MNDYTDIDLNVITHKEFIELKKVVLITFDKIKSRKTRDGCLNEANFIIKNFRNGRRMSTKNKIITEIVNIIPSSISLKRDLLIYISLIVIDHTNSLRVKNRTHSSNRVVA